MDKVVWFTGLSGSGKSAIAEEMARKYDIFILDGDNLRSELNSDLSFSMEDRDENLRRAASVAKIISEFKPVFATFITPTNKQRFMIRDIIGKENFVLVYIKCSLEECMKRDPKDLYRKAMLGEIANFTGIDSPFDEPDPLLDPIIILNDSSDNNNP